MSRSESKFRRGTRKTPSLNPLVLLMTSRKQQTDQSKFDSLPLSGLFVTSTKLSPNQLLQPLPSCAVNKWPTCLLLNCITLPQKPKESIDRLFQSRLWTPFNQHRYRSPQQTAHLPLVQTASLHLRHQKRASTDSSNLGSGLPSNQPTTSNQPILL